MRREALTLTFSAILLVGTLSVWNDPAAAQTLQQANTPQGVKASESYGKLPLTFEANRGQADPRVKFLSRGTGYTAFLTTGGMVLSLRPAPAVANADATVVATGKVASQVAGATLQFKLVGAAMNPAVLGEEEQPGRVNYFIGRNPAQWRTNVPTYARVRYQGVYPGIDLVYYGNHRQLEYDFAVLPGTNPSQIQFEITGASNLQLDGEGDLVLQTRSGPLRFQAPAIYQESSGQHVPVSGSYVVNDSTHISFHVAPYDLNKPLVIDPVLLYGTYLGGSGSDQATGIAVDSTGSVYVAGYTNSADFALTTLGTPATNSNHVFVAKLDPTGSSLVYADYIGGNSDDYGIGLALDSSNNVYVTGSTTSADFPMVGAYQSVALGPYTGFVSKISADGSSLVYSTYLGGSGFDQPAGVAVDTLGDAYVAGTTTSQDFPTVNAYQPAALANQGGLFGNYGFLAKFTAIGSSLTYSTYFAGNLVSAGCGNPCSPTPYSAISALTVDANGNAYVAGTTNTANFPSTSGTYLTSDSPVANATIGFVGKFATSGTLDYSTYFYGSSGNPVGVGAITVDGSGSAYIAGSVSSDTTFPITSTSICDPNISGVGCSDAFVSKFDATATTLLYSTFLGPDNYASPVSIVLDSSNNAYVLANTSSAAFGTNNGIEGYSSGEDMLLVEIDASATTQLFATYLGASGNDFASGLTLDGDGNIYVAGTTNSTDLPATPGAYQNVLGGGTDAFVFKVGAGSASSVALNPSLLQYGVEAAGSTSAAQTVLLRNMGSAALSIAAITAIGDFAQTSNCGTDVPAASSCTLSITFTPNTAGLRSGSIMIQDNAAGSPHSISLSGTGLSGVALLAPASLTFSAQLVGTSSLPQVVTLTNTGNANLTISNIQVIGDYSLTNNCSSTLAASSNCTVSVTFTPTVAGARIGTLIVTDNAPGSPQSVVLTGTGSASLAPIAAASPSSVVFSGQQVGTTSAAQAVTLTNTGNAALNITSIQVTAHFAQSNNCSTSLAASASCVINVTFSPSVAGSLNGTLTVSDNAAGSIQTVTLTGSGSDFSLADSSGSDSIKAGSAANYNLTVAPLGGSFSNAVKLSCTGLPAQTSCSFSPASVTPGGKSVTSTLSITTTATTADARPVRRSSSAPIYAVWIQLQGVGLFGVVLAGRKRLTKKICKLALLALLALALISMIACAGGTGIAPVQQSGTASGNYTITVIGTSGTLEHSVPVTLTVQ